MDSKVHHIIQSLNESSLEDDLLELVREKYGRDILCEREVRHLIAVLTNSSLLLTSVYDHLQRTHILDDQCIPVHSLRFWKMLGQEAEEATLQKVVRAPAGLRALGDKCLFDIGVAGQPHFQDIDLLRLGHSAYERAAQILEILADDRRLRQFYDANRIDGTPIAEDIQFLRRLAEKFDLYTEILQALVRDGSPGARHHAPPSSPESRALPATVFREPHRFGGLESDEADDETEVAAGRKAPEMTEAETAHALTTLERWALFSSLDTEVLRRRLKELVIHQEEAIDRLCDDFCLFSTGTQDPRRPSSYFLIGPTGVGKNYLVEMLVHCLNELWGIDVPYLEIEGPQYTYPSDINELKGAARGFIRSDEEGILTDFHHRSSESPFSVILIDEVEKAHPQLRKFFLSILDRGTITDNRGQVLNFTNTMFFFTSNIGYSTLAQRTRPIGYGDEEAEHRRAWQEIEGEIRKSLSPEFINRLQILHFNHLSREDAETIFDLEFSKIARRYAEAQGVEVQVSPDARKEIMDRGFQAEYGARNLAAILNRIGNITVSKQLKKDEGTSSRRSAPILRALRQMRSGMDEVDLPRIRRTVRDFARVRVPYRQLRIELRDGEFVCVPGMGARVCG